jgi:peptide-methionine (S)-S-oxide reductase
MAPVSPTSATPTLAAAGLGGGWLWCVEAVFQEVDGAREVVSGYAGGQVANPSYEAVCGKRTGHVEVVRVVFDPTRIAFVDLLAIFFVIHDPTTIDRQGADVGPQYRSAVFATSAEQLEQARGLIAQLNASNALGKPIVTQTSLLGSGADRFWPAEPEHQRYYERNPSQGYCAYVVAPKLQTFRQTFADRRRRSPRER